MGTRVLIVTHLFPTPDDPSVAPWVADQADALAAFADVSVLCCARLGYDRVETRESGVQVTYLDTSVIGGSGRVALIASAFKYSSRLRSFLGSLAVKPDVLHSHFGFPDAVVVAREARRIGARHVVTLHGSDVARVLPRRDPIGAATRTALRQADGLVCVSEQMAHSVAERLGEREVSVVPMGVNTSIFSLAEPSPRRGVLYVGHLAEVKNVDVLLSAIALVNAGSEVGLTIVGAGPLLESLKRQAAQLGLAGMAAFAGTLDRRQVADCMREAQLLVLPSSREGWPLVVGEALACGTPVVATRVGGVPDMFCVPEGGVLVEPGDATALAEAIERALEREWDPMLVASASRAPSAGESARRLAALYESLVAGPREGRLAGPTRDTFVK